MTVSEISVLSSEKMPTVISVSWKQATTAATPSRDSHDVRHWLKARQAPVALTPHPGEAARLLGTDTAAVQGNRLAAALQLSERFGCWVVLKGADSLVVSPGRELWLCPFGSPRLAIAGTGDVLAGMIGGLLAQGRPFEVAVPAAVALHAVAGESGGWHLAGELPDRIVAIIARGVF